MLEVIIGLAMSVITQIAKKTEVDAKIIILGLSLIVGTAFYFVKYYYPDMVDVVWQHTLGAYWVSQVIYNYAISIWEEKHLDSKKKNKWAK